MALKPGTRLGPYEVTAPIGAGGMGEVYRAVDPKLRREVAIKVLPSELARNPSRRGRFEREASAIAALKHPNIVTIHSMEEDAGVHFITMELVEGRTLSDLVPDEGLPLETILEIAVQLTDALASAHAKGIIHRDIKPANIMLDEHGRVKVLDFGLAKLTETGSDDDWDSESLETRTQAGQLLGTAAYMSPEQAEGLAVDARSDIFSLGIVLYQMATGKHPFQRKTTVSTLSAILKDAPPSLMESSSGLPPVLNEVIERCLRKSADDRYQTAADLHETIQKVQREITLDRLAPPRPAATLLGTLKRPAVALPVLALLLGLVGLAGFLFRRAANERWARQEALPEIQRLLDASPWIGGPGTWEAYNLGTQAEQLIPEDPLLRQLRGRYSTPMTIHTSPPGARVSAKPYAAAESEWQVLGETPLDEHPFVRGVLQLRIERSGFEPVDDLYWNGFFQTDEQGYQLREEGSVPDGMAWVSATGPQLYIEAAPAGIHLPGVEHLPPQELGDFLVDRFEVKNEDFKRFVDAGGYANPEFWKEPFVDNGGTLTWEEAVARFTDSTGRPGPATWEVGDYPDGTGDYPVTGISWFEAIAYAEFAGKRLPSIYHWDRVALTWASGDIVPFGNLGGRALEPVTSNLGLNRYGARGLAGNAREWCANETDRGDRFILGGGWNDPVYAFNDAFAQSPWDRSATNGLRCIKYVETSGDRARLEHAIDLPFRDFASEPVVSEETFSLFLGQYRYDKTPLNAVIEETLEEEDYVREKISFDAAYGGERMMAYLFLPKTGKKPYRTAVLFPGSGAIHTRSSESLTPGRNRFLLKSGQAVMFPVYKSTYERGDELDSDYPDETNFWKEHVIMWAKDLQRSIDYLETRDDIDRDRLFYVGSSWGAAMGPIMMAVEPRLKVGVVVVAGLLFQNSLPEVDPVHYIRRVKIPVLMLNGKYDFFFPYETSQVPFYEMLGTPEEHKKLVVNETSHAFPVTDQARETLAWLDRYFGPMD